MHKIISLLLSILCLQGFSQSIRLPKNEIKFSEKDLINKPFPTFKASNESIAWNNEKLLGKTVYVNFWFAACVPCMQEMPQINALYEKFRNDTNFVLLSITFDGTHKIEETKRKFQVAYEIFHLSIPECMMLNPTRSFPASFVINGKGIITFYETGNAGIDWLISRHFKNKIYSKIENSLNGH
jgi:thiol-disulfide isomerase/thioredoxin